MRSNLLCCPVLVPQIAGTDPLPPIISWKINQGLEKMANRIDIFKFHTWSFKQLLSVVSGPAKMKLLKSSLFKYFMYKTSHMTKNDS